MSTILTKDEVLWFYETNQQNVLPYDEVGKRILDAARKVYKAERIANHPETVNYLEDDIPSLVNSFYEKIHIWDNTCLEQLNIRTTHGMWSMFLVNIVDREFDEIGENLIDHAIKAIEIDLDNLMLKLGEKQEALDLIKTKWKNVKESGVEREEGQSD